MTDKEINEAIAGVCGWKCKGHPDQLKATDGWGEFSYQFVIRPDGQLVTHNSIPNYCNDLNAMHEAEKTLYDPSMRRDYSSILGCLVKGYICLDAIYATARQRAEAFLRTLGKWKEVAE